MEEVKDIKKIKSFIYLDEYKMYSISSQIFEGLTEYVTSYTSGREQASESQKGLVGSGKVLADIISKEMGKEERKFFHDYSYTLFEEKLIEDKRVSMIDSQNIEGIDIATLGDSGFVKVTGRLLFNDIEIINRTIKNFNKLGEAFAYVTNLSTIQNHQNVSNSKTGKGFANTNPKEKIHSVVLKLAKENNLHQDQDFLDSLGFILNYGYKDQFEIQLSLPTFDHENKILFTSSLKREYLMEEEDILIKKYSRYSERNFVVLGLVTQKSSQPPLQVNSNPIAERLKDGLVNVTLQLSELEKQFFGRLNNEIILDPIAVYLEF